MTSVRVRSVEPADRPMVAELVHDLWGTDTVVAYNTVFRPAELAGLLAVDEADTPVGLLTHRLPRPDTLEVVTINAVTRAGGVGTLLLAEAKRFARSAGCVRVVLTTTNDNLDALRFYQRRGFRLTELRPGGTTEARRLKPEIPLIGSYGIPMTDELDLELSL